MPHQLQPMSDPIFRIVMDWHPPNLPYNIPGSWIGEPKLLKLEGVPIRDVSIDRDQNQIVIQCDPREVAHLIAWKHLNAASHGESSINPLPNSHTILLVVTQDKPAHSPK